MSEICTECKDSIISQTVSKIAAPLCNEPCPEAITCVDIRPSNCVFYAGANLSCSGIVFGETLTTALGKINTKLCQNSTSNTVQITANDTCYGYLASKITSSSLAITITSPGACEKLNIEEKCFTWSNIAPSSSTAIGAFRNKWKNVGGVFQQGQYSSVKACQVKLRGLVTVAIPLYTTVYIIAVLPSVPLLLRTFSVNYKDASGNIKAAWISLQPTGTLSIDFGVSVSGIVYVPLDGINYETT